MILNDCQEKTVEDGVNWFLNSSEQVFEIDGEAGTGKSVVISEIVRRLGLQPYQCMPMAYTGQAAIVMRLKGFVNAKSIHSFLYELVKMPKEYKANPFMTSMNTQFNVPEYKFEFVPRKIGELQKGLKLMIIDEGYMVPDYMRTTILKHGVKVLVCGDCGQLDPIGGQPAFLTGYNIHHLTEIMRQNLDNPIVYLAHRARYGETINNGLYGNRALVIDEDELSNNMIANLGNIICGTNKTRDYFNQKTRDILHIDSLLPMYGERIICRENDWNREQDGIALANGLSGVVSSPKGINSFNGKTFDIDFLPDLLTDSFIDVPVNYEYMISPYDIRQQIKENKYREGELFEFAYAKTTHLAQGAEYPSGIYYEEFLRSNIQNKLNYTGISRFRDYMIYVKKKKKFY